jgi:hypothetical protein
VDREKYLANREEYAVARMLQAAALPRERTFALLPVARAYTDRETLESWHNSQAAVLADGLRIAAFNQRDPLYTWGARFPRQPARGVRFQLTRDHPGEWCVHEFLAHSGDSALPASASWRVLPSVNRWDGAYALDRNLATRWRTWEPMRAGDVLDVLFESQQTLSGASILSHTPVYRLPLTVWLMDAAGVWTKAADARAVELPPADLRRDATRAVRGAGFAYILAPMAGEGYAALGQSILRDPQAWGLAEVAHSARASLLRILPE